MISRCDPMLCEEKNGLSQVKAIVHWQHQRGEEAHCLVRVYADRLNQRTVVLLSEIRSNSRVTGLMSDLEGVANALWICIGDHIVMSAHTVRWVAHHGSFSSYDAVGNESFTEVEFRKQGNLYFLRADHRLSPDEVTQMIGVGSLESVYDALRELGWTKHNG